MITRLDKVTIYVKSQDEAKGFCIDKVGSALTFEQPMGSNMTWIEVAPEGENLASRVHYSRGDAATEPRYGRTPFADILATDVEGTSKSMKAKGIEVPKIQSFPYGKVFNFKDQDGNLYLVRE